MKRLAKKRLPAFVVDLARVLRYRLRSANSILCARRLARGGKALKLELGAGAKRGTNGWLTLDLSAGCDLCWDLRNGLPFPDEVIQAVYSSHFLEHLSFKECQELLKECLRVLVPGGSFSVCVPNARLFLEAYVRGEVLQDPFLGYKPAHNRTTRIDYANYVAYMDGAHKYMFDEENLLFVLSLAGFERARLRSFDATVDSSTRAYQSICAEANKPFALGAATQSGPMLNLP
jgi:predicted SAM-dependent methyltransferase